MQFSMLAHAGADVDFSKAYVIPEKSSVDKVTIGGVKPLWSDLFYSVDFNLTPEYNLKIEGVLNQSSILEQLEQRLRNTTWQGTYVVSDLSFSTTLRFIVVQDGYIGAEVYHINQLDNSVENFLRARVTGDIISQFQIDDVYVDKDRISSNVIAALPLDTPTRQLIRIKRVRAYEFSDGEKNSWATNREYRLVLENNILTGIVGTPNDLYGSGDGTSENGAITLMKAK